MSEGQPPQKQGHQPGREWAMQPEPDYRPRFDSSGKLMGKVALITGGDSGIGRATAILFAREGADVAIVYLSEDTDAEVTAAAVRQEGRQALLIRGDVGDKSFCDNAVSRTVDQFGGLDVLVNNAAEQHPTTDFEAISEDQLRRTFETNMFGCFYLCQAAMPHLEGGGAIVNTTSVTAYRGSHHLIDYASTKGAIVAFTRSLSQLGSGRGVRVNAVAPGPIWTPLIPATFDADQVAEFGTDQPLGRAGQPNEVASALLFLACEDASYMTGQVLHPNGGEIVGG
ncbi:SDR family oxidoreductase [Maricaulis sp. CAU 1757]